jgi:hypothetical protein
MKKLLYLLSIVFLTFQSCSSSDDSSQSSSSVLLKKAIWNDGSVYDYLYQGNKITKIQGNDGSYSNFTYTGDFITKVESVDPNNSYNGRDEFLYSGNNLIQIKEFEGSVLKRKIDFVNNNDNTRTRTHTLYNGTSTSTVVYKEYYLNDEFIKQEKFNSNGAVVFTTTFLYDDKNYIFKNVTGYKYILNWYDFGGPYHNTIKTIETSTSFNNTTNYLFEYNSNNYPTSVTTSGQGITDIGEYYY